MQKKIFIKSAKNILLLILFAMLLSLQFNTSMTFDEPLHISAGYSKILTGDYRMNTEHPPLIQIMAGLPLLLLKTKLDTTDKSWTNKKMAEFTRKFFFVNNKNPKQMLFYARTAIIMLTLLLAMLIWKWAQEIFGNQAAITALAIYVFEPNILAHGMLTTTDMGFAFFAFLAVYTYWKFCKIQTKKNLAVAGITMGLAQLTKYTAIFLWPVYLLMAVTIVLQTKENKKTEAIKQTKTILMITIITIIIINTAYLFQGTGTPIRTSMLEDTNLDKQLYHPDKIFGNDKMTKILTEKMPSPLPYYYVKGLGFVINEGSKPSQNTVFGKKYENGAWHYYITAFAVKTTIPFLLLIILAIFLPQKKQKNTQKNWQLFIIPALVIFIAMSMATKQTGIRYILAIFPFLIIWMSGRLTNTKTYEKKYFKLLIIILITLHSASSILAFPNYIAYYNEAIGSENGWKYFTDTNTDWGQDFDRLLQYTKCTPNTKIQYFGTNDLEFYGLKTKIAKEECQPEILAISAEKTTKEKFQWLKQQTPFGKIGKSILLYNITKC